MRGDRGGAKTPPKRKLVPPSGVFHPVSTLIADTPRAEKNRAARREQKKAVNKVLQMPPGELLRRSGFQTASDIEMYKDRLRHAPQMRAAARLGQAARQGVPPPDTSFLHALLETPKSVFGHDVAGAKVVGKKLFGGPYLGSEGPLYGALPTRRGIQEQNKALLGKSLANAPGQILRGEKPHLGAAAVELGVFLPPGRALKMVHGAIEAIGHAPLGSKAALAAFEAKAGAPLIGTTAAKRIRAATMLRVPERVETHKAIDALAQDKTTARVIKDQFDAEAHLHAKAAAPAERKAVAAKVYRELGDELRNTSKGLPPVIQQRGLPREAVDALNAPEGAARAAMSADDAGRVKMVASGGKPGAVVLSRDAAEAAQKAGLLVERDPLPGKYGGDYWHVAKDARTMDLMRTANTLFRAGKTAEGDIVFGHAMGYADDDVARYVAQKYGQSFPPQPRVLTKEEALAEGPSAEFLYHGTTPEQAMQIVEQGRMTPGHRAPAGVWFAEDPKAAAFFGDTVIQMPRALVDSPRLPLGNYAYDRELAFREPLPPLNIEPSRDFTIMAERNPHYAAPPEGGIPPLDETATAAHIEQSLKDAKRMPTVEQNPTVLRALFDNAHRLAVKGAAFREWYRISAEEILAHVRGDKDEAYKLAQLFGIYSANKNVPVNSLLALRAYDEFLVTKKITEGSAEQIKDAMGVMSGTKWDGRKTNTFTANLSRHILDKKAYRREFGKYAHRKVTVDVWMKRMFDFKGDVPTDAQYTWIENHIVELARQLGWSPEEVQAATWVALKSEAETLSKGRVVSMEEAAFDFAHGIDVHRGLLHLGQMSDEVRSMIEPVRDIVGIPGAGSIVGPSGEVTHYVPLIRMKGLPAKKAGRVRLWRARGEKTFSAATPESKAGMTYVDVPEAAIEQFKTEKGYSGEIVLPKELTAKAKRVPAAFPTHPDYVISSAERQLAKEAAAAYGHALDRPSVAYGRVFQAKSPGHANAVEVVFRGGTTPELEARLAQAVGKDAEIVHMADGVWLVNRTKLANIPWQKKMGTALERVRPDIEGDPGAVVFDGGKVHRSAYENTLENLQRRRPGSREALDRIAGDVRHVTERDAAARAAATAEHSGPAAEARFDRALARSQGGEYGAFLSPTTAEALTNSGHRLFMGGPNDEVHFAISRRGDFGYFSSGVKGAGGPALEQAIAEGARTLDAFDGYLPGFYERHGFREVARNKWNDEYAPPNWDYKKFGRPDVVHMAYLPDRSVGKKAPYVGTWVEGKAAAQEEITAQEAVGLTGTTPSGLPAIDESVLTPEQVAESERGQSILDRLADERGSITPELYVPTREHTPRQITYEGMTQQVRQARGYGIVAQATTKQGERAVDYISTALERSKFFQRKRLQAVTVSGRVVKYAGRAVAKEADRAKALMKPDLDAIGKVKEGSDADFANFWYAQLPADLRNAEGLQRIAAKQTEYRDYLIDAGPNGAEADIEKAITALRIEHRQLSEALDAANIIGDTQEVNLINTRLNQMRNAHERYKLLKSDISWAAKDTQLSIARIEKLIEKPPLVNQRAVDAVDALSRDREQILVEAGHLESDVAESRRGLVSDWLGLEPTGEEAYIGHRMARPENFPGPPRQVPLAVGRVRVPAGVSKQNRLLLASNGRLRPSLRVAAEDWQSAQIFRQANMARNDLGKIGTQYPGGPIPEDMLLLNTKGRTIPKAWKSDEMAQFGDNWEDSARIRQQAEEILNGFIAQDQATERIFEAEVPWEDLRLVPKRLVERYYGQFRVEARGAGGRAYDQAVDAMATSIVFFRIGYIPKNVAQNLIMSMPHQGAFLPLNLTKAAQLRNDPEIWHLLQNEVGSSGQSRALGTSTSGVGRVSQPVRNFVGATADDMFRVAALLHEMGAERVFNPYKPFLREADRKKIIEVLTNEKKRPLLNDLESRAVESMADFNRLTPQQMRWARRFGIVPAWLVAGTRYPFRFAADHPVRSGLLAYMAAGEPGAPDQMHFNQSVDEYFHGSRWLEGINTPWGRLRTGSISPVSTPYEIGKAAAGLDGATAADYANPTFMTAIDMLRGEIRYPGGSFHAGYRQSVPAGLRRLAPSYGLIHDLISPPSEPFYPEDVTRLGRLKREAGVVPIQVPASLHPVPSGSGLLPVPKRRGGILGGTSGGGGGVFSGSSSSSGGVFGR